MLDARPRRRRRSRWSAEWLEARVVPAVFNVNSLADVLSPPAGTVTLRSAIRQANTTPGPNTINLAVAGTYRLTLPGTATDDTAGELSYTGISDLKIVNASGGLATIDGGGLNRVLQVDPSLQTTGHFTVTLQGLTITGGSASSGGGIEVEGAANLILSSCVVSGCTASGPGGGIEMGVTSTGNLSLFTSAVVRNHAGGDGGGIDSQGTGAIGINAQSQIVGNSASFSGGGINVGNVGLGLVGATVSGNVASSGNGGGVRARGNLLVSGSLVETNFASGFGGGIASTVGNLAMGTSFLLNNAAGGNGGGLDASGPTVTISNVTAFGNAAGGDGGGMLLAGISSSGSGVTVGDSTIAGNSATSGGGVDVEAAHFTMTGSTVEGNHATNGGGISAGALGFAPAATISNSLFLDNVAFNGTSGDGGGLWQATGTLGIANSEFTGNTANRGGALFFSSTSTASAFTLVIGDATFDGNRSLAQGGALFLAPGKAALLINDTIAGNAAGGAGGGIEAAGASSGVLGLLEDTINGNSAARGGGVDQSGLSTTVGSTILAGNSTTGGGPDYNHASGPFTDDQDNVLGSTAGTGSVFGGTTFVGNPMLGRLEDNGGASVGAPSSAQVIRTEAVLPGSPIFGRGDTPTNLGITTDARGFARHAAASTPGAYEPMYASNAPANAVFVEVLYETLFDRTFAGAELANCVGYLNAGGSPTSLVAILESTPEYLSREAVDLTRRYLDRAPTASDTSAIINYLSAGHTPEQVATIFLGSAEFASDYGNNRDVQVEALYQTILERPALANERGAWDQVLAQGMPIAAAGSSFLATDAYVTALAQADAGAYLGRMLVPSEALAYVTSARAGTPSSRFVAYLLGSGEAFLSRA